jgi:hypothetical protein
MDVDAQVVGRRADSHIDLVPKLAIKVDRERSSASHLYAAPDKHQIGARRWCPARAFGCVAALFHLVPKRIGETLRQLAALSP